MDQQLEKTAVLSHLPHQHMHEAGFNYTWMSHVPPLTPCHLNLLIGVYLRDRCRNTR